MDLLNHESATIQYRGYNTQMRSIERRSYLRLNDAAAVTYQAVSEEQFKQQSVESVLGLDANFSLRKQLFKLELDARELQRELSERDRKLGSYIHNLNQRMEVMTAAVVNLDQSEPANLLDISPAGASFLSNEAFPADDLLAVKISFHNVSLGIACFAMVRYSLIDDRAGYRLGIQFISADVTTENLIERHISAIQAEERRKRLHGAREFT